jgi:hypothetical protein
MACDFRRFEKIYKIKSIIAQNVLFSDLNSGEAEFYKMVEPCHTILFLDTYYPIGYLFSHKDGYLLSTFQGVPARKQILKGKNPPKNL